MCFQRARSTGRERWRARGQSIWRRSLKVNRSVVASERVVIYDQRGCCVKPCDHAHYGVFVCVWWWGTRISLSGVVCDVSLCLCVCRHSSPAGGSAGQSGVPDGIQALYALRVPGVLQEERRGTTHTAPSTPTSCLSLLSLSTPSPFFPHFLPLLIRVQSLN